MIVALGESEVPPEGRSYSGYITLNSNKKLWEDSRDHHSALVTPGSFLMGAYPVSRQELYVLLVAMVPEPAHVTR